MSLSEYLASKRWAIEPAFFEAIVATNFEAAHAQPANKVWGKSFVREGSVGVIGLRGVVMQDSSLLSEFLAGIFGATVLDSFKDDLTAALADKAISQIVLDINSPGGEAMGVEEAAAMIRKANAVKPVTALVDGMAASAAYWLGSAAGRMVMSAESSQVGSIGVVLSMMDTRERDAKAGVRKYEIVSSQSPMKRIDIATDEGRAAAQQYADQFASIFINAVGTYRGKDAATVETSFGKGHLVFAKEAIAAGMADSIQGRDALMAELRNGKSSFGGASAKKTKGLGMNEETTFTAADVAAQVAKATADATKAERTRIAAILGCKEAEGRTALARTIAVETDMTPEAAGKVLGAAEQTKVGPANPLATAMDRIGNPVVGAGGNSDDGLTVQQMVAGNLALVRGGK